MTSELFLPGTVHKLRYPLGGGQYWLNPALVEAWGRTWLIPRVGRRPCMAWRLEVFPDFRLGRPLPLFGMSSSQIVAEDPRAIFDPVTDRIVTYYVGVLGLGHCAIHRAEIAEGGQVLNREQLTWIDPEDAKAYRAVQRAMGNGQEKNWVPFRHEGRELCLYDHAPFTVLELSKENTLRRIRLVHKGRGVHWDYGEIRGGAPPFRGDLWWSVFHSSRPEPGPGGKPCKVYYAGVLAFNDDFEPVAMTPEPIMGASVDGFGYPWGPNDAESVAACFPCGAIVRGENLLVSYGWLDAECRIAEIPLSAISERMERVVMHQTANAAL